MLRLSPRIRIIAAIASIVAGYIDTVGFLALSGFFVSFMSGNATRMGVGFATHAHDGKAAVGLIFTFVMGVTLGSLLGAYAGRHRRSVVLALVTVSPAPSSFIRPARRAEFCSRGVGDGRKN